MLITFEGGEGSGKSTQIKLLYEFLSAQGIECITTFEPGNTLLGQWLRKGLLEKSALIPSPLAELFLFCADRAQHTSEIIVPALKAGKTVLCDRFIDATTAYQGYARGIDISHIKELNRHASMGITPDFTVLLDIPASVGLSRVNERSKEAFCFDVAKQRFDESCLNDRFETEQLDFHEKVRQGYLQIANDEAKRFVVIDANRTVDEIHEDIKCHINKLLKQTHSIL
ncbi:MAG: dTMP kinase [Deltaproteobacteria bacterium]